MKEGRKKEGRRIEFNGLDIDQKGGYCTRNLLQRLPSRPIHKEKGRKKDILALATAFARKR
jgi:hypothetical protein